jgi:hypothetical protein
VILELKKYLKRLEAKKNMQVFFFLDIKTSLLKPHSYIEGNEYTSEDAFDRFLKIRFFPMIMGKLSNIFNVKLSTYH